MKVNTTYADRLPDVPAGGRWLVFRKKQRWKANDKAAFNPK